MNFLKLNIVLIFIAFNAYSVDFQKQIKPIFEQYCYKCHGAEKQKATLRMDSPDAVRKGGKSGQILLAGKPEESDLLIRVKLPIEDDDAMPGKGKRLTNEEISLIEKWIREGADFGDGKLTASEDLKKAPPFKIDQNESSVALPDKEVIEKLKSSGVLVQPESASGKFISVSYKFVEGELDLESLQKLSANIVWLDLSGKNLEEAAFQVIAKMKNLRRLSLQKSRFKESLLEVFTGLQNLEYVNLYGTQLSDKSLVIFAKIKSLKKLYVWRTSVTDSGIKSLKANLPNLDLVN